MEVERAIIEEVKWMRRKERRKIELPVRKGRSGGSHRRAIGLMRGFEGGRG